MINFIRFYFAVHSFVPIELAQFPMDNFVPFQMTQSLNVLPEF